jgi:hypothetical protein
VAAAKRELDGLRIGAAQMRLLRMVADGVVERYA